MKTLKPVKCSDRLPAISGRYVFQVEQQNDLGKSTFPWNCYFNKSNGDVTDNGFTYTATHWYEEVEESDERYFIVFYTATTEHNTTQGTVSLNTTNGSYINRVGTINNIKEYSTTDIINCVFTNILEINKADFITYRENE